MEEQEREELKVLGRQDVEEEVRAGRIRKLYSPVGRMESSMCQYHQGSQAGKGHPGKGKASEMSVSLCSKNFHVLGFPCGENVPLGSLRTGRQDGHTLRLDTKLPPMPVRW